MNFKDIISNDEINETKKITVASFISKIENYNSLDHAMVELPAEYLEFYMKNEKVLLKATKKMFEDYNPEAPGYLGYAPKADIVTKKIKYKGQFLLLTFDPDVGSWTAIPSFRGISQALKYGKSLINEV